MVRISHAINMNQKGWVAVNEFVTRAQSADLSMRDTFSRNFGASWLNLVSLNSRCQGEIQLVGRTFEWSFIFIHNSSTRDRFLVICNLGTEFSLMSILRAILCSV